MEGGGGEGRLLEKILMFLIEARNRMVGKAWWIGMGREAGMLGKAMGVANYPEGSGRLEMDGGIQEFQELGFISFIWFSPPHNYQKPPSPPLLSHTRNSP